MDVKGRVALVTGSSRGIGKATALMLAEKGCNVVVNYVKNREKAEMVSEEARRLGVDSMALKADVSKYDEVEKMVEAILSRFGRIDILVNNAGIISRHVNLLEVGEDEWDEIIDVNLKGAFNCCKAVVPHMIRQRFGRIVNVSSIAGRAGGVAGAHYAASKAGLIGLTFSLASELARYGITVNAVAPTAVETDMLEALRGSLDRIISVTPLGRIAKPEEVAHAILFLRENDFITAEVVDVNGGRYPS